MHRFYLPPERCQGSTLLLDAREAHHASRVLRLPPGAPVIVLDGAGGELQCEISALSRSTVELRVRHKSHSPPPPFELTLLQAIPKGKLMDFIVQKATELGVSRIVPLLTARVVVQLDEEKSETRAQHWRQLAVEAIKQCGSAWLPAVDAPVRLEDWCARRAPFELSLLASLERERVHPRECFDSFQLRHGRPPCSCALYIGPEGDFTSAELALVKNAGAQSIRLAGLVLRAETAALCGVAALTYESDFRRAPAPGH